MSFTQYFDHAGSSLYSNSVSLGGGFLSSKHKIGIQISNNLLFGKDNTSYQVSGNLYKIIMLKDAFTYRLYFKPQINIFLSKQTLVYETTVGDTITLNQTEIFDLLNTQIEIPFKIHVNNFDMGVAYIFNIPHAVSNEPALDSKGLFNLSIGYMFNL